ncbi:MAG: M23 family metallopeptidase [Spirochaetaceae bacterium]|jgi:murein DD-endopeptidase MepM/ murein hydrolase activator NlpD|nr:M23 family metallopeptidase [Spirochaetaceae bacterium]
MIEQRTQSDKKTILKLKGSLLLRLIMGFSIVYYTLLFSGSPLLTILGGLRLFPLYGNSSEAGMGGMSYLESGGPETAAGEVSVELAALTGVPEPAEFSKPRMLLSASYRVRSGDTISDLAEYFGLNQDTLHSINEIKHARLIQIGQILKIPNQDGIIHRVKRGETLASIAGTYRIDPQGIRTVNELFSNEVEAGTPLFIPGARLDWADLQEINGDLFSWPLRGYITSPYGYRASPFTGVRQFHSGIDIGAAMGTPIRAAMSGRVSSVGYDDSYGNFVVVSHHSGYRTFYGHLSVVRVKPGTYVGTGERIGDVGTSGRSTGPHLHFTVYKNGITVNPRALIK